MENQISTIETMANDTGMPDPDNSLAEYVKYLLGNKLILNTNDENVLSQIKLQVAELAHNFPLPTDSSDFI